MRSERGWRSIKPNTFAGILYRSSSMRQLSRRPIVRLCTDRSWLTRNERFSRHLLTNLRSFALTLRPNVLDYVSTTDPFPDELTFSRFTRSTIPRKQVHYVYIEIDVCLSIFYTFIDTREWSTHDNGHYLVAANWRGRTIRNICTFTYMHERNTHDDEHYFVAMCRFHESNPRLILWRPVRDIPLNV